MRFSVTTCLVFVVCFGILVEAKRNANQKLKICCARQKNADKSCKRKFCDFDHFSQDNVLNFLNTCTPKGSTVSDMWQCANSNYDHTECCKKAKVIRPCMAYCKGNEKPPTDYLKHLFCLQAFNPIRNCFREHLEKNANIFGDE